MRRKGIPSFGKSARGAKNQGRPEKDLIKEHFPVETKVFIGLSEYSFLAYVVLRELLASRKNEMHANAANALQAFKDKPVY